MAGMADTLKRLPYEKINLAVEVLLVAYRERRGVFLFGNGGSAALASHLACDLGKGTVVDGAPRFRVLSLTDNVPLMTSWANDARYEDIFAEQLRNFIQPKDVAFAISGSGNSPNVLNGLRAAQGAGAFTIALTGFQGGKTAPLADLSIIVTSDDMQYIEDLHLSIAHCIFRAVRQEILEMAWARAAQAVASGTD
jgi:D-sedoheptulose 7-phosphate isomerase